MGVSPIVVSYLSNTDSYVPLNHDFFGRKNISGKIVLTTTPGRLIWNLQIIHLERKMIFQTFIIIFLVNLLSKTICLNLSNARRSTSTFVRWVRGLLFRQGLNHLAEFTFFKIKVCILFFPLGLRNLLYDMSWLHPKKQSGCFFKRRADQNNIHFLLRKINHPTITTKIDSWKRSFSVAES